jgi:membrane fusion protein (multidrug efflux system)
MVAIQNKTMRSNNHEVPTDGVNPIHGNPAIHSILLSSILSFSLPFLCLFGLSSCRKESGEPPVGAPGRMDSEQAVEVMEVALMTMRQTVDIVGTIAANESAELRAEIPGVIESIHFEEGNAVRSGDVLVKLDTRELEAQLAETRASFELAERNLERNKSLLEDDAVSRLEVDSSVAEHERLKAAIALLEVRLAKSSIRAPFDGIAGGRSLSVGDYVNSQSVITTVDDLSRLKVEMDVPERYLPHLKPGGTFTLRAATSAPDGVVTGQVYFVSPRIDPETRATQVKGHVKDPPPHLKPGMFANITLVLQVVENALVVPETAILSSPRGTVLVMPQKQDGSLVAAFTPVKTGLRTPGFVQITPVGPPVRPGDQIVSAGVGGLILYPGVKLKPVKPVVTPEAPQDTDRRLEGSGGD